MGVPPRRVTPRHISRAEAQDFAHPTPSRPPAVAHTFLILDGSSMALNFEWDPKKAEQNWRKHGVSFQEAKTLFGDPLSSTTEDLLHSSPGEQRLVIIGQSVTRRTLVVVHTKRGDTIRIISARVSTSREREEYEEG